MDHLSGLCLQGFSPLCRAPGALDHGGNVAPQMHSTQLSPLEGLPAVGASPIRHPPSPKPLT